MKKRLLFLMLFAGNFAFAQPNQIAKFFPAAAVPSGGAANIQNLVSGYITPIGEDFGALINNGWYATAENHKKWGFDLQVTATTIFAKSEAKTFTPGALTGVSYTSTVNGDRPPTAYGSDSSFPVFNITQGTNAPLTFAGAPGGIKSGDIPMGGSLAVPTITGGLGLFANTDIRFRFTPAVKINDTELKNWGVGIQHDIKQHIPGLKMVPFSLSVLVAYSQLTATTDLSGFYSGSGQQGIGETKAYTAQVLVSKSLSVVTFYAGLGYNSATTSYDVKGSYLVDKYYSPIGTSFPLVSTTQLNNPFHEEYTTSGFRATGGIRFKFGPVALNGDYSLLSSKGMFTAGFGFSFR